MTKTFKNQKYYASPSWTGLYPTIEVLADGTFVLTTYGHWEEVEEPYILSVRF